MLKLPSCKNQSVDLLCKSIDCFQYDGNFGVYELMKVTSHNADPFFLNFQPFQSTSSVERNQLICFPNFVHNMACIVCVLDSDDIEKYMANCITGC